MPCASHLAFGNSFGFALEHFDELAADDLALLFGFGHAGQMMQEFPAGIDMDDLHVADFRRRYRITCSAFVQAQQAVVHEHAGELVADGTVDQRRRHRGIHPAGQTQDHFIFAHLRADIFHRLA